MPHSALDGRRKPKDEDVGLAAHAMRENRLLPCIFKKISYVFFYKQKQYASWKSKCLVNLSDWQRKNTHYF